MDAARTRYCRRGDASAARRGGRLALGLALALLALLALAPAAGAVGFVYQDSFGVSGTGLGEFNFAEGVALDGHGAVYVTDYFNDRVQKFTSDGVFVGWVGGTGAALGQFNRPSAALVDSNGKLLVGEYTGGRVQVLSLGLTALSSWGSFGPGVNQFNGINQIAEDSLGNIYVTEYSNGRVQKFDAAHAYVGQWAVPGASGIAIDENDTVFVASWNNGIVSRFDTSGTPVGAPFGSTGTLPGQLSSPSNLAFAPDGSLLVGEGGQGRVSRFDPANGDFLGIVVDYGSDPGEVQSVWGVAVDDDGTLYVADRAVGEVRKYVWDDQAPVLSHNYDGEWHSDSVTVGFSAVDDFTAVPWLRWTADNGATWTDTGTMTVTADALTHAWDGINSRTIGAGDSVSNWAYKVLRVKIDTRAPVSSVSGVPAGWTNQSVTAHIGATDAGSGVDDTYYDLDGAGLTEMPASGDLLIDTAGHHVLQYWSEDNCVDMPNQEAPKTVDVYIDQMGPTAFPRYAVAVRRGSYATFKYGLVDDFSPTCAVKLVIKKKTKTVKTVNLGVRSSTFQVPEHFYSKKIRISLPAGTYTWTVVATDLAGNIGSWAPKKLTVKP